MFIAVLCTHTHEYTTTLHGMVHWYIMRQSWGGSRSSADITLEYTAHWHVYTYAFGWMHGYCTHIHNVSHEYITKLNWQWTLLHAPLPDLKQITCLLNLYCKRKSSFISNLHWRKHQLHIILPSHKANIKMDIGTFYFPFLLLQQDTCRCY